MATVTGTQRQLTHTSNTYESNTTIDVAGNITVGGTVDGIDIAARDACLTATINTANAALPKAGGAMTGAITTTSTFDGRNVSVDGTKLDGICCGATTCTGTITCVAAGNGLTGGATSGAATLTVGAGTAITVAAGTVGVTTACDTAWNAKTTCTGTVCTLGNLGVTATAAELNFTTGVTSAIQTQLNAKTTCTGTITCVAAGTGLTGGGSSGCATLCHSDTSAQGSINNSNGTVIQDVTLDTYGHVTSIGSYNLDSRYYTETESDGRYLRNSIVNSLSSVLNICEPSGGNIIYDLADNGVYIPKPSGASYHTLTNVHTGAIAIKLPTATWNNSDMISFHVDIYDYAGGTSGESVTLYIYGFHQGALTWVNVGAVILSTLSDKDYTVRFGHDGTRPIVWIGETTSTWNFPQIIVRDVQAGNTANHVNYYSNWDVVPNVTTFGTVNLTSTGNYPYAKAIIGPIYTVATLPAASPAGQRGFVTNSTGTLANSIGQTLTAGGGNTIPVYSDGSSWKAG
jgi:hypothetical protein